VGLGVFLILCRSRRPFRGAVSWRRANQPRRQPGRGVTPWSSLVLAPAPSLSGRAAVEIVGADGCVEGIARAGGSRQMDGSEGRHHGGQTSGGRFQQGIPLPQCEKRKMAHQKAGWSASPGAVFTCSQWEYYTPDEVVPVGQPVLKSLDAATEAKDPSKPVEEPIASRAPCRSQLQRWSLTWPSSSSEIVADLS